MILIMIPTSGHFFAASDKQNDGTRREEPCHQNPQIAQQNDEERDSVSTGRGLLGLSSC